MNPSKIEYPNKINQLFSNSYVEVNNVSLEPEDLIEQHFPGLVVLFSLNKVTLQIISEGQDKGNQQVAISSEEFGVYPGNTYGLKNSGNEGFEFLEIVRSDLELPERELESTLAGDILLYQSQAIRVQRTEVNPGESRGEFTASSRLIFSHTDYVIEYNSDIQETIVQKYSEGDFYWHEPDNHKITNVGTTSATFTIFEFFK